MKTRTRYTRSGDWQRSYLESREVGVTELGTRDALATVYSPRERVKRHLGGDTKTRSADRRDTRSVSEPKPADACVPSPFLALPPSLPFALEAAFFALLVDRPPIRPNLDAIQALEPRKPSKRPGA